MITFSILKVDNIEGEALSLSIDGVVGNTITYNHLGKHTAVTGFTIISEVNAGQNQCNLGTIVGDDVSVSLQAISPHTSSTLDVLIYFDAFSTDGGWGIKDYQLFLEVNCNYQCNQCNAANSSICTACAYNRISLPSCSCPSLSYDDGVNAQCQSCPLQCGNCTSNVSCTTCAANRDTAPNCNCSGGYYQNGTNCTKCSPYCLTCNTTASNCLTCLAGRVNAPTCGCNVSTFDNGINATCQACSYKCLSCNKNATNCTACGPFRKSVSICDCLDGYFDVFDQSACERCSYKCLTCSQNSTNCLTCSDASRKNAPSCDCIVGTYDVNNSAVCKIGINCVMSPVAQFSDLLDQIIIQFNVAVELTASPNKGMLSTQQNCIDFFDASTVNLLGQSPSCYIINSTLIIKLGLLSSIVSTIQLSSNVFRVGCSGTIYKQINITLPVQSINPNFNVSYTPFVKFCLPNSISLVNLTATGSRSLQSVQFFVISPQNSDLQTQFTLTNQSPQLSILITPNILLDNTVYEISVTITNFLHNSTTKRFTITTLSSQNPYIQLIKGGPYKVFQQIILKASLSLSSCDNSVKPTAKNVSIQWNIDGTNQALQSISSSSEYVQIIFPPFTFNVGQTIHVLVYATVDLGQAQDQITFVLTPSQLITNILGGSRQQGRPQALSLEAVFIDSDAQDQSNLNGVIINWSCENAADGTNCSITDQTTNQPITYNNSLHQVIPANTLIALQSYIFFINVIKVNGDTQRQASAQITIKVDSQAISSISILYPARLSSQMANLNEQLFFIVQKNILSSRRIRILANSQSVSQDTHLTVDINYNGNKVASFYPTTYVVPIILDQYLNGLYVEGQQTVQLQFKYNDPKLAAGTLLSNVYLTFNIPPQLGSLVVNQTEGQALSTNFLIQMVDWVDQAQPLSYKFGYYTTHKLQAQDYVDRVYTNMVILNDWSNNNYVQTILPQGTYNTTTLKYDIQILGFVQDSSGGQTIAYLTLNVKPYLIKQRRVLQQTQSYESYLKTLPTSDYSRYEYLSILLNAQNLTLQQRLDNQPMQQHMHRQLSDTAAVQSQSLNDSITLLGSIVDQANQTQVIDSNTIQNIIQSTQQIVQLQSGGCSQQCFGNGVCSSSSDICSCQTGYYLDNCLAQETQYDQILKIASNIITLIGVIKNNATIDQSSEDQLMRSLNILIKDKNVIKVQSSDQITSTVQNTQNGFQSNFNSYNNNGGSQLLSVTDLIYQVSDVAQNQRLASITSTVGSTTDVNDKLFVIQIIYSIKTATSFDNSNTFNASGNQDALNKNLMAMSSNTTDFYANSQFTDQSAKVYKGTNMGINAQKLSSEASLKYFPNGNYLYAGGLSDEDESLLVNAQMNGSGDMQMSVISYNTNPYNSDSAFPYQNQSSQMVSPNFKDASGSSVTPSKPLTYQLSTKPPANANATAPNVCITEQKGTWTNAGCTTLTSANNAENNLLGGSDSGSSSSSSGSDSGSGSTTTCNCEVSTKITVVADLTSMFTNSNIDALWDPSLLVNFQFWRSAIFYIALVITVLWIVFSVWGWRRDIRNKTEEDQKAEEKKEKKEKKEEDEKELNMEGEPKKEEINDEKKFQDAIIINETPVKIISQADEEKLALGDKKNEKKEEEDSDEENQAHQEEKKRNVGKQFMYSLPMLHEVFSIFSQYSEEEPRPIRFTIYYLKMIIMMALTSIFGQSLNATQNVVFSLICVALMNPVVLALTKGFAPSAPMWKKLGAIFVVLVTFGGCWYTCLVISALMGIQQSNIWVIAYSISLAVNIFIMQIITIFLQVLLTPYIKANIDSGNLMIRILYFYLFQENVSDIVDTM